MGAARRRLQAAVLKLKAEIAVEREKALAHVAEREQVLNQTIEGQYKVTRDRLLEIRAQIEAEANKLANINVKGKKGKNIIGDTRLTIQAGLNQVNAALEELARKRADALKQLSDQVRQVSEQIEAQTTQAYSQIETEDTKAKKSILRQEISPVVYHWYRKILGRDPSQVEYDAVITGANYEAETFDLESLKITILNSMELSQRTAQVLAIKTRVQTQLLQYLTLSQANKIALAQSLGITSAELVEISASETNAVLDWLLSRSLHFGQSAYLALEALLTDTGHSFDRVDLASRLILTDILTGVLTPLEQGDLVISVYSLRRTANYYGLDTHALKLNYDALKAIYDEACAQNSQTCNFRLVAHIDGDHYVIITKVTDQGVTYIDPGAGPEQALDQMTLNKGEFLKTWIDPMNPNVGFGFVLLPRAPPAGLSQTQFKTLTTSEEMSVRGAFFPLLIPIFAAIFSAIAQVVAVVVNVVIQLVTFLVNGLINIFQGIGNFFGGILSGNFSAAFGNLYSGILNGIGQISGGVSGAFNSLHGALLGGVQGIAGSIPYVGPTLTSLTSTSAFANALSLGMIGFGLQGTGVLLEKIGVSPKITQTLISGGKIVAGVALLATGNPLGLGFVAGGTSEMLNLYTSLSPTLSAVIGIGAAGLGAFAGGFIDTSTLAGSLASFKSALPYLSMDLASAGVAGIGNSIGLDPRLSSLIAIPVAASIGNITGNLVNGLRANVFQSIKNALTNSQTLGGLVSIGANFGLDTIGAPPIVSSFLPNLLGSLVSGGRSGGGLGDDDPSPIDQGGNILKRLADNVLKFGKGIVSIGQQVVSFGTKVIESVGSVTKAGFAKAVDFFSGLFDRKTQETLIKAGNGNIQNAILNSNFLDRGDGFYEAIVNFGGVTIAIDWNKGTDQFNYTSGDITVKTAGLGMSEDRFFGNIAIAQDLGDGIKLDSHFVVGDVVDIEVVDPNALKFRIIRVNPGEDVLPISITDEGMFYNIPISGTGFVFSYTGNGFWNDPASQKTGIADLSKQFISDVTQDRLRSGEVPLLLIDPLTGHPAVDREGHYLTANSLPLTLYQNSNGIRENALLWGEELLGGSPLSSKLEQELRSYFDLIEYNKRYYGLQDDQFSYVHFAHSGNFMPMLKALDKNPTIPIKTIISYEGPDLVDRTIHNPNLDRIIQVRGTQGNLDYYLNGSMAAGTVGSIVGKDFGPGGPLLEFRDYKGVDVAGNERAIDNIHIEILGARHEDFDYHPTEPNLAFREISRKTNLFMRELQEASTDELELKAFLNVNRPDGSITKKDGKHIIDPMKFKSRLVL